MFSEHTIRQYGALAKRFLDWLPVPIEDVTRSHMIEWINEGSTPSQKRWRYLAVNALGRMLVAEEIIDRNPADRITMPKEPVTPQPILTDDALAGMLATCNRKTWAGIRDYALLLTMANTGMRRSEVIRMNVVDVDLDGMRVLVPKSKTGVYRTTFFDHEVGKAMLRWLRVRETSHDAMWLSQRGQRLSDDGLTQMVYRRAEAAGVEASPHMFRRRFAAKWMEEGGSQTALQTAAGWRSGVMVDRYTKGAAEKIADAEYRRLFDRKRHQS
jgi:integrase/recombinase XerD